MNGADTAWVLLSTAVVLLMTPALAFFYGGLVREKNALNTMMMSFGPLGFAAVGWALLGYSQTPASLLVQTADLAGVHGVSFVVAAVNAALAGWWLAQNTT